MSWFWIVLDNHISSTCVSLLTVANINTYDSDGRQNHTPAAMEQWSSASLPLTGGYFYLPTCLFLFLYPKHVLKMSFLIAATLVFFLEEVCLELARAIEAGDTQAASQHASALARQKAVLTIQPSEKNYADGEIRWEVRSVRLKRLSPGHHGWCVWLYVFVTYSSLSVLQFNCSGGGCVIILLCHSESVPLHDCGCTQATG